VKTQSCIWYLNGQKEWAEGARPAGLIHLLCCEPPTSKYDIVQRVPERISPVNTLQS
jgi:hypothetical protein